MTEPIPPLEHTWTARNVRPVVGLYVTGVFSAFMGLAHFVVHSPEAVKALFLAWIGGVAGLGSTILAKTEYRLGEAGLQKRPARAKTPRPFRDVFAWDELSHVQPTGTGFKYYKRLQEPNPLLRFWKLHVAEGHSGECQVEDSDRQRVLALLREHGIPLAKPEAGARIGGGPGA